MYLSHYIDQSFEQYHLNSHSSIRHFTRNAAMFPVHMFTITEIICELTGNARVNLQC